MYSQKPSEHNQMRPFKRVRRNFDFDALKRVCEMHETEFTDAYGMTEVECEPDRWGDGDFYCFKDNGADVLFVGHLDTVVKHGQRTTRFLETDAGPVVHSGALDDRLGVYIGLELLPRLGLNNDWLLTTGEEGGNSTGQWFDTEAHFLDGKVYDWVIEFDRGGTDVVMYQYENWAMKALVEKSGARVGIGAYSDISYMEHLRVKMFNWGVGYQDYHSTRGHAYLWDTWKMVAHYLNFHAQNAGTRFEHTPKPKVKYGSYYGGSSSKYGGFAAHKAYTGPVKGDEVEGWVFNGVEWEEIDGPLSKETKRDGYVKVDGVWINESLLDGGDEVVEDVDSWWEDGNVWSG